MDTNLINKSIETGELQLEFKNKITHFAIVWCSFVLAVFVPLMVLFYQIYDPASIKNYGVLWFSPIFAFVVLIFYFIQKKRLKFSSIKTNLSREKIDEIIKAVSNTLKWHEYENTKETFIAKTHPKFSSGSWGEQITIIFDGKNILVNSICDPDNRTSVVSMGRNAQNVRILINKIKTANGKS